jgi:hypothetical protein
LKLACIKQYVETCGLYHGVSYSRWIGLLYNPMEYVQRNRDAIFDEIVAKSIDVLDIT